MIYESATRVRAELDRLELSTASLSLGESRGGKVSLPTKSSKTNLNFTREQRARARAIFLHSRNRVLVILCRLNKRGIALLRVPLRVPRHDISPYPEKSVFSSRRGDRADNGIFSRHGGEQEMRGAGGFGDTAEEAEGEAEVNDRSFTLLARDGVGCR